jgi:N-acetylmuramoyl-L-alanine amidase
MKVTARLITPNEYSRPQKKINKVMAVVMHWTANPSADAIENRDFFDSRKTGMGGCGSAHYIVGQNGEIVQCIPENEIAYHCGSSEIDPESRKIYTDYARMKFGRFAMLPKITSPNFVTIGIEMCPVDMDGNFTDETIVSAAELCADIIERYNLTAEDITTHHAVVGWKDCPKLWVKKPELFEAFKLTVSDILRRK